MNTWRDVRTAHRKTNRHASHADLSLFIIYYCTFIVFRWVINILWKLEIAIFLSLLLPIILQTVVGVPHIQHACGNLSGTYHIGDMFWRMHSQCILGTYMECVGKTYSVRIENIYNMFWICNWTNLECVGKTYSLHTENISDMFWMRNRSILWNAFGRTYPLHIQHISRMLGTRKRDLVSLLCIVETYSMHTQHITRNATALLDWYAFSWFFWNAFIGFISAYHSAYRQCITIAYPVRIGISCSRWVKSQFMKMRLTPYFRNSNQIQWFWKSFKQYNSSVTS